MRFSPAFLDEIRARVPVSEVVGRRVKLKKQGREWAGLSPFNKEKTPSFFVNDQKGFYHCFSSGKHGDVFNFVMDTEGLPFTEAVERLAGIAGMSLPQGSSEEPPRQRNRLLEAVEAAARYFQAELKGPEGAAARSYLGGRGVSPETIARFRIGYAPPRRGPLRQHLVSRGFSPEEALDAGLLTTAESSAEPFERFRERIIFPIEDSQGRPIAFGGRTLDPHVSAKYLNSPETALFHKGALLYNQHRARPASHASGTVVLVEGYLDVIALAQAGRDDVVAPLGTAVTGEQLDLLWRLAPEPILCFDGDGAGRRAAWRAVDLALPKIAAGRSLRFAFLPEGQDPDDLVRSAGRPAADAVLDAARPLSEVLIAREMEASPTDTPERKAELERRLGRLLGSIADESVRRHYRRLADERLNALFAPAGPGPGRTFGRNADGRGREGRSRDFRGRSGQAPIPRGPSSSLRKSPLLAVGEPPVPAREATLLVAAINHPELADRHCEAVSAMELSSTGLEQLRQLILQHTAEGADAREDLQQAIVRRGLGPLFARLEALVRARREWWSQKEAAPEDAETGFRHTLALHVKVRALHNELRSAEAALAREPNDEHFRRVVEVQRSLRSVEGTEATIEGFGGASGRPA